MAAATSSNNLTVAGGTVRGANVIDSSLGSGADLVQSGATIDLYGGAPSATNTITINGTGVGGNGALLNSSDYAAGNAGLNVVLGSASSIGVTGAGNLTLGTVSGGYSLTKVGSGSGDLILSGAPGYSGDTLVNAGTLSLTQMGLSDTQRSEHRLGRDPEPCLQRDRHRRVAVPERRGPGAGHLRRRHPRRVHHRQWLPGHSSPNRVPWLCWLRA